MYVIIRYVGAYLQPHPPATMRNNEIHEVGTGDCKPNITCPTQSKKLPRQYVLQLCNIEKLGMGTSHYSLRASRC